MTEEKIMQQLQRGADDHRAQLSAGQGVFDGNKPWSQLLSDLAAEAVAAAASPKASA